MTVNNVNALLTYAKGQPDLAGGRMEETAKGSFEQIMSKVNGRTETMQAKVPGDSTPAAQTVVSVNTAKNETASVKTEPQGTGSSGKSESAVRKDDESVNKDTGASSQTNTGDTAADKLEKSGEELVQDIADEMDVTREEVEAAMALLGLTAVQLFDPDNLRQLLLTISGSQDELALLTDESLYGNLQNLLEMAGESLENLQKELGLSEEELKELMNRMLLGQEESGMTEGEAAPEVNLEGMKDYTVSVQKDGETVQMKVTVDDASGDKSVHESVTGISKAEVQTEPKMQQDASADSGKEGSSAGHALLQAPEMPVQMNEAPEAAMEYRSMQTEEIMNQIVEYMKINLKADTQTMELQLHPASLGTVNVQLMAKEGGLTAHFTTQNEAVRAVIETQLIQLKNQFEEQGIKVDAVEVTVANHAYGQQFSHGNENEGQEQAKAGKGRRRINLDQIESEEDLEEMEDSERIAVEMMQASGNTVDYTA